MRTRLKEIVHFLLQEKCNVGLFVLFFVFLRIFFTLTSLSEVFNFKIAWCSPKVCELILSYKLYATLKISRIRFC